MRLGHTSRETRVSRRKGSSQALTAVAARPAKSRLKWIRGGVLRGARVRAAVQVRPGLQGEAGSLELPQRHGTPGVVGTRALPVLPGLSRSRRQGLERCCAVQTVAPSQGLGKKHRLAQCLRL